MKVSIATKIIAVLVSGLCYYFGSGLNGNLGWLMWIAPIPILLISLYLKPARAFGISFLAYLIGRISWLPYLLSVLPTPLALLFTFILPIVFALIIIASRRIVLISPHWFSALAFPILVTGFEYFMFMLSRDGTMTSIAYTQSNYLTVIQMASITGILGITFLITFVPSAITLAWYFRPQKKTSNILIALLLIIAGDVFIYGLLRLHKPASGKSVTIGMIAADETVYSKVYKQDASNEIELAENYLQEVSNLADQGARIILLPEKAISVRDSTSDYILQKFSELAIKRKITIVMGGAKHKTGYWNNNAWVISDQGKLLADYQKVNLFAGEVIDNCKPGIQPGIFSQDKINEGVAICKDMDFQQFILGYSKKSPAILYVPAWDFKDDGWLHARMAIMRSIEGGFSLARNAREGRLTISDWRGKLVGEANSESGTRTVLTGKLFIQPHPTTYARAGDWFGTISLFAALGFLFFIFSKRKINGHSGNKKPASEAG